MNKERLQNYNETLYQNNLSLEDINNTINELPDVSALIDKFEINNCYYLFAVGARLDCLYELLALCKNVTSCYYMFYHSVNNLTEVDLSNFDTSKCTTFSNMFYNCSSLKKLNLKNLNTSQGKDFSNMFGNCHNLAEIDVSSFDTSNATHINSMFYNMSKLESLDLENFNISKVTEIANIFSSCRNLKNLNISSFDFSNLPKIYYMMLRCPNLENLKFGTNLGKAFVQNENNYSYYKMDLSGSPKLTYDSLISVINGLYDLNLTYDVANGGTLYTQQFVIGAENISKLNAEELNSITNRGWVVS